jgi:hypothetical protein
MRRFVGLDVRWMLAILGMLVATTVLLPFVSFHKLTVVPHQLMVDNRNSLVHLKHESLPDAPGSKDNTESISSNACLTRDCIHRTAARLARTFPDKTNRSAWIIHNNNANNSHQKSSTNYTCAGIIYVKNFKAASSTAAGIALRIAYRHHPRQQQDQQQDHAWVKFSHVRGFKYAQRDPERSILFSSLRDPAARAISRIFYTSITQKGERPTDENLLQKLRWNHRQYGAVSHQGGGYQVRYCSMHQELNTSWAPDQPDQVVNPAQVERNVDEILRAYDFIMVAERMDESVVALALLLGLDLGDVLVMDVKQNTRTGTTGHAANGDYLYFSRHDPKTHTMVETCRKSVPAVRSPAVQAHLESTEWYAKNYGDYLLHAAALQSLDRTIVRLGPARFHTALTDYRRLKTLAKEVCTNETISHCSSTGQVQRDLSAQNCYSDDSGCGYACIDLILAATKEVD